MTHTLWQVLLVWPIPLAVELSVMALFVWTVRKAEAKQNIKPQNK